MKPVVFDPDARAEVADALAKSAAMSPVVAAEFRHAIDDVLADIATNPAAAGMIPRTPCRQRILTRFPYSVVYADEPTAIRIVAFVHHSRRPGYWKKRLRPD